MKIFKESAKVCRVRKNARVPVRCHPGDAGIDFFFAPESQSAIVIQPGTSAIMETGIKISVPSGHMLQIMNKSGIASKRSLLVGACVVDYGYDGEVFINLHNVGKTPQVFEPGMKLAQGVFIKISRPEIVEVAEDSPYPWKTSRGQGSLGSTGDK